MWLAIIISHPIMVSLMMLDDYNPPVTYSGNAMNTQLSTDHPGLGTSSSRAQRGPFGANGPADVGVVRLRIHGFDHTLGAILKNS